MITVYVLLCMAKAPLAPDERFKFWEQCNSSNAIIYGTVTVQQSSCEPPWNGYDDNKLLHALPDAYNPAWRAPNWVKYECHAAAPTS